MITLFRKENQPEADEIQHKLDDLVLAYRTELLTEESARDFYIRDGKNEIRKEQAENWLLALENELKWQRSLSGDGCYIDPETGSVC
jgi:hypothetical protein